ncbi:MAG: RES family NAD+ phosphorylase [Gammaproteobacteria bacterium]|nr:RES family NAD+ phosphorylase [Gammaproteobacteria bacterium]MCF6261846.1 RES family NAD+ phosphorylase [Gammaproteobacteria bacterium]
MSEYPSICLSEDEIFYRIRINPKRPHLEAEYDSPPIEYSGSGRLDSDCLSVFYGSQDLQVCIHECRVSAEDEIFVATFQPVRNLKLLDLTAIMEEGCTEFESLDMAIHMLFLAGKHSYEISRDISRLAKSHGYDGVAYPSYFSLLRSGGMPFETTYGLSHRRIPQLHEHEKRKIIKNLALFGRPLSESAIRVKCINKLVLSTVEYGVHFGPVEY